MMKLLALTLAILSTGCTPRHFGTFRVLPQTPAYILESPDAQRTPFSQILSNHTKSGYGWIHLQPGMAIRIEKAFYDRSTAKNGLKGFIGTEIVRHTIQPNGQLSSAIVETQLLNRPRQEKATRGLVPRLQRKFSHHRFLYAIVFEHQGSTSSSVLLGANSSAQLDALAKQLIEDPDRVCGRYAESCSVFHQPCTVSVEMGIAVNGKKKMVDWGTQLIRIAPDTTQALSLHRRFNSKLTPVEIDPADLNARRLPLLPGDEISWK